MAKVKLTAASVSRLHIVRGRRVEYWDVDLPGFHVRVSPQGRRTYGVWYRVRGRSARLHLGLVSVEKFKAVRERARLAISGAGLGQDARRPTSAYDLLEIVNKFIDASEPRRSLITIADYRRMAKKYVAEWARAKEPISELQRGDLREWLEAIAKKTPVGANRLFQLVRAAGRWAVREEYLVADPTAGMQKPRKETSRERVLSDDEIKAMWKVLEDEPIQPATYLRVQLLLGQRYGETVNMRWADLDFEGCVWRIPGETRKGGRYHVVPLAPFVVELLEELRPQVGDSAKVFPAVYPTNRSAWFGPMQPRLRAAGVEPFGPGSDLRRTCASGMARLGTSRNTVALVLGHATREGGKVTGVYDRFDRLPERATALSSWAAHVKRLAGVAESPGKVLQLARA